MLVTFTCDAYEDITLFGDVAKELLNLMGQSGAIPGAILAVDLPEALSRLEQGLARHQAATQASTNEDDEEEPNILLSQRAFPLINLLKHAIKRPCDVIWAAR